MRKEIEKTIELEGGYVNDPNDSGGETNFGISKRNNPDVDIKNLTKEDAGWIYERKYFQKMGLDNIPDIRIRWKVFDMCVNMGEKAGVVIAQIACGLPPDGSLGPKTFFALGKMIPDRFLQAASTIQALYYNGITVRNPTQEKFLGGWLKRARDTGEGLI